MDEFLSNNVNAFTGDILLCDAYVVRMYPELIRTLGHDRSCYSYAPETCHIDQLGFKLGTILRLGRVSSLDVLTKDGSPHSVQIPLVVQESATNSAFPFEKIRIFVVEKDDLVEISHHAVRAARHLSEINEIIEKNFDVPSHDIVQKDCFSGFLIAVLIGGRSDLNRIHESGMLTIFDHLSINYEVSIISSEQNPEELRTYCRQLAEKEVALVICIAGSVPGLPAAVKAHLPAVPVIGVPLSVPEFSTRDILLASLSVPARRPIILTGVDEVGLKKAAYLACDLISCGSIKLRTEYERFLRSNTPSPDFGIDVSTSDLEQLGGLRHLFTTKVSGNGKEV